MQISGLRIKNFKSIRDMRIDNIENALILVGKNSTGKTSVLDAVRAVGGSYEIRPEDFQENCANIEITVKLGISPEDLRMLHQMGSVSQYRRYEAWIKDFQEKLPAFDGKELVFEFVVNQTGKVRYSDGVQKHNPYIRDVFPQIYYIDTQRELRQFQENLLMFQENEELKRLRTGCCMFDQAKRCNYCFSCIGLINKKKPEELNVFEASKLLDYKLYQLKLDEFATKVNVNFQSSLGNSINN